MLIFKFHCLTHFSKQNLQYGSLKTINCFPFENFLGHLKKNGDEFGLFLGALIQSNCRTKYFKGPSYRKNFKFQYIKYYISTGVFILKMAIVFKIKSLTTCMVSDEMLNSRLVVDL